MFPRYVICAVLVVMLGLAAGCGAPPPKSDGNDTAAPNVDVNVKQNQQELPAPAPKNSPKAQEMMQVTTYHATEDAMYLVPETQSVPKTEHPLQTALENLVAGPQSSQLVSVVPAGTKVLGVKVKNHIAYADFSDDLIKSNHGGSTAEMMLVAAIVDTLTEFPEVEKVQIMVNGKKIDTITGHLDTSQPLARSENLIKR
ncbi:MAG: gerM [Firmicutes bacterium]|nr:gerM [Bacillota bacterium]